MLWERRAKEVITSYFALCGIFKNEHALIREWIGYHRWIGVSKFYVYDHGSVPPLLNTILDFVQSDLVEYHYFQEVMTADHPAGSTISPQTWVYEGCLRNFGHRHRFMGLIDVDEFLVLTDPAHKEQPDVVSFLRPFEAHGGLSVYWQIYGSSYHESTPNDLGALASYVDYIPMERMSSWKEFRKVPLGYTKSILNTQHAVGGCNPHACHVRKPMVNAHHEPVNNHTVALQVSWDRIALFHYSLQSAEEYRKKMSRGTGHSQFVAKDRDKVKGKTWKYFNQVNADASAVSEKGPELFAKCCQGMALRAPALAAAKQIQPP